VSGLIVLACLYGPCVIHKNVMQVPIPLAYSGKSESTYIRETEDGIVIVYVPVGGSI
jgi:hypothetical protein